MATNQLSTGRGSAPPRARRRNRGRKFPWRCRAEKLKLVFVGTEVAPWSKVGGLADVMSALPTALASKGHDVMTVVPRYSFSPDVQDTGQVVPLLGNVGQSSMRHSRLHMTKRDGVDRVFVEHLSYTQSSSGAHRHPADVIYPYGAMRGTSEFEVGCNVLCQSAIYAPLLLWKEQLGLKRGDECGGSGVQDGLIFVCNDWPCTLLPLFLQYILRGETLNGTAMPSRHRSEQPSDGNMQYPRKKTSAGLEHSKNCRKIPSAAEHLAIFPAELAALGDRAPSAVGNACSHTAAPSGRRNVEAVAPEFTLAAADDAVLRQARTLFVIHNMEYTGPNLQHSLAYLDLARGGSWMEVALLNSHAVATVSPGYAEELQSSFKNSCLRDLHVTGIMNGIDTSVWNPGDDPFLSPTLQYAPDELPQSKQHARHHLQRRVGLRTDFEGPLFGFIGRLEHQKGVDVLLTAVLQFFSDQEGDPKGQFVLLGCGDPTLEAHLRHMRYWFPGFAVGVPSFNERLAHEIHAGCDFLVIPSRSEPCGLVGLSAVRYGAVPIAPAVGGLKELVQGGRCGVPPLGIEVRRPVVVEHSLHETAVALVRALHEAVAFFGTAEFCRLRKRCMDADVSWDRPVLEWIAYIQRLADEHRMRL